MTAGERTPPPSGPLPGLETPFLDHEPPAVQQRAESSPARLGELEAEAAFSSAFDLPSVQPGPGERERADEPGGELASPGAFELEEAGIIDGDNRVRVKDTTGVPWRWICKIDVADSRGRPAGAGTGLLISNRHVLTAAHVVHDAYKNMQQYTITVIPALDGLDEPFGRYALASKPRVRQEYDPTAADSLDWDYALLTLASAVGEQRFKTLNDRPLCFWGSPQCGESTMLARLDPGGLNGKAAYTAGYPGGKGGRQLWCAAGILHSANQQRRIMYTTADTTRGHSGSPVWVIDNKRHCLVGIAAGAGTGSNRIVRVTGELVRQLRAWITEGGETPAMVETEEALEPPLLLLPQPEAPPLDEQPVEQQFDPTAIPRDVAAALGKRDWPLALRLAIQAGWRDENELTNLIFFARHPELPTEPLKRDDPNFERLSAEWIGIRDQYVRPVLEGLVRSPMGVPAPRVVFLPGILGSVLTDQSLTAEQARRECEANLGMIGNRLLRGSALYPCDKRPETLWGGVGSLHWLFSPEAWGRRMRSGNGLDMAGNLRAESLFDVDIRLRRRRLAFRPYASFLRALRDAGADVLVFPYDWRLSNRQNAHLLQQAILTKWFGGQWLRSGRNLSDAERITFIGHSMGGLIARFFVESAHDGWKLTRRLITIGTPHLGAPAAFLHFTGRTFPFPENPFYQVVHDIMLGQMAQAGVAPQATFRAEFLPGRVQTDVFQFMASAIELMPVYSFVQNRGRLEPLTDTYRTLVHAGTRQAAMQLIERFRNGLLQAERLEEALGRHNLEYHFLAADGFPTVLGYEQRGERIITKPLGDGSVPLRSARVFHASTAHVHVQTLTHDRYPHQQLCERPDVQAYCLNVLNGRPRPARAASMSAPQLAEISRAPRYIAVASPSEFSNEEWRRAWRRTWAPVYEDYALLKVLFMLRQQKSRSPAHVHSFQVNKTSSTPLDFSGLNDNHVIFIVGHGDSNGLYAMGPGPGTKGMRRLIECLTGDGNLKKRRRGKSITIVLLSCRAGLGLHKALARELAEAIEIEVTVVGALGFTFGSANTDETGFNSVLIKGIPWWMEYETSIEPSDAEKETSKREGKTITIAGKKKEIEAFKKGKETLEKALEKVVGELRANEVNAALNEIETKYRKRFVELVILQSTHYQSARKHLEFDMWFERIPDAYQWVNSSQVTDDMVTNLLSADWPPPGPGQSLTR